MKTYLVLAICLVIGSFISDPVDAGVPVKPTVCATPLSSKKCGDCGPFQICCSVKKTRCTKQCSPICRTADGAASPIVPSCPTKVVCEDVKPEACNGKDCKCRFLPPNQCKPICRKITKPVCKKQPCVWKNDCKRDCKSHANCAQACARVKFCPPDKCEDLVEEICTPRRCKECKVCRKVPDCGPQCGNGYCLPGQTCGEVCKKVCTDVFVPECVNLPVPVKDGDDDDEDDGDNGDDGDDEDDEDDDDKVDGDDINDKISIFSDLGAKKD